MQIITRQYNIYKFDELSKEAQAKVLDKNRDWNVNRDSWAFYLLEEKKEYLKSIGFDNAEIHYSGFWSQGDGASFTATVDIAKWLAVNKKKAQFKFILKDIDNVNIVIAQSGFYSHEMTMSVDVEYFGEHSDKKDSAYMTIDKLGEEILEDAREEAGSIYKALEAEYEYLTSDEVIKESLIANEGTFTEDGEIFS